MQQIDWSKAPDDATHGGQDEQWFYFYKDITPKGCKYWQVNKTDSNISNTGWESTSYQPCAYPLFVRPTVLNKTRGEALAWCVENLEVWPFRAVGGHLKKPEGWLWVKVSKGFAILYPENHECASITRDDWSPAKFDKVNSILDIPLINLNCPCVPTPPVDYTGEDDVSSRPSIGGAPLNEAFAAIDTLKQLDYTYNGGQLWKPPIDDEYDGWNVGDECWISNQSGRNINGNSVGLLGFNKTSIVISLFVSPKGSKMAVVHHDGGLSAMWDLDMLKRPLTDVDRIERRFKDLMNSGATFEMQIATILGEYDIKLKT